MSEFVKGSYKVVWIPVRQLSVVWLTAQREFDARHARNIADNFDPDMFGILSVTTPNGDGIYHVIDGHHRKAAVQMKYGDDEQVPCIVFPCSDPSEAAAMFDRINTGRKQPQPIDRFRVRVTARYHTECAVARIVNQAGYKISMASDDNVISCVAALVAVYSQNGANTLAETLEVIRATFGKDRHAVAAVIVKGYASFLAAYAHAAKIDRLVKVVQKAFTPGRLLAAGKAQQDANRCNGPTGIKLALLMTYNKGARVGQELTTEMERAKPKPNAPTTVHDAPTIGPN